MDVNICEYKFLLEVGEASQEVKWEGHGQPNRKAILSDHEVFNGVTLLPVATHRNSSSIEPSLSPPGAPACFASKDLGEMSVTGDFYNQVNSRKAISYHCILPGKLWLGSCPRGPHHMRQLKDEGIDAVMNFMETHQIIEDCFEHLGGPQEWQYKSKAEVSAKIDEMWSSTGIRHLWLETKDGNSAARCAMLPHASLVLAELLDRGRAVYVHCRAGVGRSTFCIMGYLMYCMGLSCVAAQHLVCQRRTVVFIDEPALLQGIHEHPYLNKDALLFLLDRKENEQHTSKGELAQLVLGTEGKDIWEGGALLGVRFVGGGAPEVVSQSLGYAART